MAQEQVTQADRDAAADFAEWQNNAVRESIAAGYGSGLQPFFICDFSQAARRGVWDNHPVIQAFAAHRIASTTAQVEAAEKMAEAIQWALGQARGISATTAGAATTHGDESGALGMCNSMASDIAINLEAALAAWEAIKENEHGR